jgi:hypothetical protein
MKKTILLMFALLLLLAACNSGDADPEEAAATEVVPVSAVATPTLSGAVQATLPPVVVVEEGGEGETAAPTEEAAAPPEEPVETGPTSPWPWPADAFAYGVQSHAVVGDPAFTMDVVANQLGMEWVKVQLEWPLVQPDPETLQWFFYDGVVDEANRHGVRLMFSVVGAPAWTRAAGNENGPPDDYNQYAAFLPSARYVLVGNRSAQRGNRRIRVDGVARATGREARWRLHSEARVAVYGVEGPTRRLARRSGQ